MRQGIQALAGLAEQDAGQGGGRVGVGRPTKPCRGEGRSPDGQVDGEPPAHAAFGDKTHVGAIDGDRSPLEVLCDEFARHLLIPEEGVRAWLARATDTVGEPRVDERIMALLARHFGASPEATRIQLDRMGLLSDDFKDAGLPSGRRWAYRYGWGTQFDSDQATAEQPRVPRRILDRAIEAYREGKLGIGVLAKLQDRSIPQMEQALSEVGVFVQPAIRRADIAALVARGSGESSTGSRSAS